MSAVFYLVFVRHTRRPLDPFLPSVRGRVLFLPETAPMTIIIIIIIIINYNEFLKMTTEHNLVRGMSTEEITEVLLDRTNLCYRGRMSTRSH